MPVWGEFMHILIVGAKGVGKSTLISRILDNLNRPVFGFTTKKEDEFYDEERGSPVYIYDVRMPKVRTDENIVGFCKDRHSSPRKDAFDRYALKLREIVPNGHIVVMDEIGFMEASSDEFCDAVISLLDGDSHVIAAVKDKDIPFLKKVRAHKNCRCFYINSENRDYLYDKIMDFIDHDWKIR